MFKLKVVVDFIKQLLNVYTIVADRHISELMRNVTLCSLSERNIYHLSSTSQIDKLMTYSTFIIQTLRIISVTVYLTELEIKDTKLLPLPTWICSHRSGGTVYFELPFMTRKTVSISISQTFRFRVPIYHLGPSMAFNLEYDTLGLAPRMNVLFKRQCDFPITFFGRNMSRNV